MQRWWPHLSGFNPVKVYPSTVSGFNAGSLENNCKRAGTQAKKQGVPILQSKGRMADQGANPEIKIDVGEEVAETDKKREDPAEESRKVEDIAGFKQRYIDEIESYIADVKKSPEIATVGSGFYRVLRDQKRVPEGRDQDLYAPTCVDFRNIRKMLMEDNPGEDTKKKLRHYYHHLYSVLNRIQKKTPEVCLLVMKRKEKEIARWYEGEEDPRTDFPQLLGLLLSGCFITDLFYKWHWDEFSLKDDPESLARLCQASSSTQDTQSDHLLKYFEDMVNGIPGFWQKVFYKYFRKPQLKKE
ncbi:hypothetical protein H6P81_016945 [Aristolochia fimbriata]|uniref:Uncharacterized protein n=1 Tax=Aristolochia fimbriata TaxID=158543 RepID=A0AAV7DZV3_ARIFI|nr:hypothetical protein H6P81_016945 [Aristolochia fimbriata]